MSELKLLRKVLKVDMYGESFTLKVPTLSQIESYEEELTGKTPKEMIHHAVDFLEKLGLPASVSKNMDHDDFVTLVQFVRSAKKN